MRCVQHHTGSSHSTCRAEFGDLQLSASTVPHNVLMLSILPLINAQLIVSLLLELPLPFVEGLREEMRHGADVRHTLTCLAWRGEPAAAEQPGLGAGTGDHQILHQGAVLRLWSAHGAPGHAGSSM